MSICAKKEWCQICMEDHIEGDHKLKTNNLMKNKELLSWQDITPKNKEKIINSLNNDKFYPVKRFDNTSIDAFDGASIKRNANYYSISSILLPAPLTSFVGEDVTDEEIRILAQNFLDEVSPGKEYGIQADLLKYKIHRHIKEFMVRFYKLALSSNKVTESEEESIAFVNWVRENYIKSNFIHDVWIIKNDLNNGRTFTTKELFNLFKQQK